MAIRKTPIRIAIADDHTMFRDGIVELLTHTPDKFEIVAKAGDGQQLIDLIGKLPEQPEVCLLDIDMPVLDGYETLVQLKKLYPMMKFLILTMKDTEFAILKMIRSGANGYLLKEDDSDELKRAIEYVTENDFYATPLTDAHKRILKGTPVVISANELTFLKLCYTELVYKEIAAQMGLSVRTVEGYRDDLFEKLNVNSRIGLVMYALKNEIVNL